MKRNTKNWACVLGLTGGMGSGKSTVLADFKKLGAFTLDADAVVARLLREKSIQQKLRRLFGKNVLNSHGLDKKSLASLVFSKPLARRRLEKFLHPLVEKNFARELKHKKGLVAVCDVPLLFEAGWKNKFDAIVVVNASNTVRKKRLVKKGFAPKDIEQRWKAQLPLAKKTKQADFVVQNNGSKANTSTQVRSTWQNILTKFNSRGIHGLTRK